MKRTITALILALCIALGIVPTTACAAHSGAQQIAVRVVRGGEHGQIALSASTAAPGETILLTADPEDGYLAEVSAVSTGSVPAAPEYRGLDTYAVTMPEGNLTLEVSFLPAGGRSHPVQTSVNDDLWGAVTVSRNRAREGEAVRIEVIPAPGFVLERIRAEDSRGREAEGIFLGTEEGVIRYEARMPGSALSIRAVFAPDPRQSGGYRAAVTVDTGLGGGAWLDTETACPGEIVALICEPDPGYRPARISGVEELTDVGDGVWIFPMPPADVEVHVLFLREENPFLDINETQFCYDSVLWALEQGITEGIDARHFGPTQQVTRAAVVTMLWRHAGCPAPDSGENPFRDVPAGSWYEAAVRWAVQEGITTGLSTDTFGPAEPCTRAQTVTFLWRSLDKPQQSRRGIPFTDVEPESWYTGAVLWALEQGITTGLSTDTFGPGEICLRAQLITFLHRAQG